jgi:plasmid maintenance system antidote protein VapI
MNILTRTVKEAVERVPCSTLKLALAAGVPHSSLSRAFSGERAITPAVAAALAATLDRWAHDCQRSARAIRQAQRKGAP